MAYTAPTVRSVGDAVTAADYNIMANDVIALRSQLELTRGRVGVSTAGVTVTFPVSLFTSTPTVTLAAGFIQASGAAPGGFPYIPYGGGPSTTSVVIAITAGGAQAVDYIAINNNV